MTFTFSPGESGLLSLQLELILSWSIPSSRWQSSTSSPLPPPPMHLCSHVYLPGTHTRSFDGSMDSRWTQEVPHLPHPSHTQAVSVEFPQASAQKIPRLPTHHAHKQFWWNSCRHELERSLICPARHMHEEFLVEFTQALTQSILCLPTWHTYKEFLIENMKNSPTVSTEGQFLHISDINTFTTKHCRNPSSSQIVNLSQPLNHRHTIPLPEAYKEKPILDSASPC